MKLNTWFFFVLAILLLLTGPAPVDADSTAPATDAPAASASDDVPFDPFDHPEDASGTQSTENLQTVADPLSGYNRVIFHFNDKFYFWVLKPTAIGYRKVMPTPVRVGIKNFFHNLLFPVRLVNCLLQGKGDAAGREFSRFVVNTTAGMAGLIDQAKTIPGMNPPDEDLGQTLAKWHVGNGFYIVWPLFGPSTARDTVGSVGDWALNPFGFMQLVNLDAGALTSSTTNVAIYGVRTVNTTSFHIGDYEVLKNAALDPYEAFRNAYIQHRNSQIAQ